MLTPGDWHAAESGRWNGDVRFVRTDFDKSGVGGVVAVSNRHDVAVIAAAKKMYLSLAELVEWEANMGGFPSMRWMRARALLTEIRDAMENNNHGN